MRFRYEIDEELTIKVWDTENPNEDNQPILLQKDQPDGTVWENHEQAKTWIEQLISDWLLPAPTPEPEEE